ncbi:MAG: rod shape-determining protein [Elusimicrobia bacterium]|nr:rod shape-determining protein [Elusimicrobiota bacterium]
MMDFLCGLFSNDMAVDLGTANTLVYVKNQGIVLREPSVVAIDRDTRRILAIGAEAKGMLGRTPSSIIAVRPLRDGVIADFAVTQEMIRFFIRKVHDRRSLLHPRIVIAVPSCITEVERRAVREAAEQAGAREVVLIEEVVAAAIGADLPIAEARASFIVDIGGGTTEAAVISLGGIVVSRSVAVAGDEMDLALIVHFRREYGLVIGENTAEDVKLRIGSAFPLNEEQTMEVRGRDQATGLPKTVLITSEEIRQALMEPVRLIVEMIRDALKETPAQLSADLVDRGLILSGGGCLLRGFPEIIRQETELAVSRAAEPLTCVAAGAGRFLEELDRVRLGLLA